MPRKYLLFLLSVSIPVIIVVMMLAAPIPIHRPLQIISSKKYSQGIAPLHILVISHDICLKPGDHLEVILPKTVGVFSGFEVVPHSFFKVVKVAEKQEKLIVTLSLERGGNTTGKPSLVKGHILIHVGYTGRNMTLERSFYAYLSYYSAPVLKSEALLLIFRNSSFVEVWHWYIRAPHNLTQKLFIAPRLENFTLRKSYLSLEMFVKKVVPRRGVWWPLSNYGPSTIGRDIDEVLRIKAINDHYLLNVSLWPSDANGVTVAYSGFVRGDREGALVRYVFKLGFTSPLSLYIIAPRSMILKKVTIPLLGNLEFSISPYAPPGYVCYYVKVEKAILSTYSLELLFEEKKSYFYFLNTAALENAMNTLVPMGRFMNLNLLSP